MWYPWRTRGTGGQKRKYDYGNQKGSPVSELWCSAVPPKERRWCLKSDTSSEESHKRSGWTSPVIKILWGMFMFAFSVLPLDRRTLVSQSKCATSRGRKLTTRNGELLKATPNESWLSSRLGVQAFRPLREDNAQDLPRVFRTINNTIKSLARVHPWYSTRFLQAVQKKKTKVQALINLMHVHNILEVQRGYTIYTLYAEWVTGCSKKCFKG